MVPKPQKIQKLQHDNKRSAERLLQKAAEEQAEFVFTELQTAIVFCDVALSAENPERRARNIENALKGYQTALHFLRTLEHDLRKDRGFQEKLASGISERFAPGTRVRRSVSEAFAWYASRAGRD